MECQVAQWNRPFELGPQSCALGDTSHFLLENENFRVPETRLGKWSLDSSGHGLFYASKE